MNTLLIDDDEIGVFLTKRLFEREGLGAGFAALVSPVEAVASLQQQACAGQLPQVVLLDLNMPGMSGWDVLEALKPLAAQLQAGCHVYILTSSLSPWDAARVHQHPLVTGLVHKPLDGPKIRAIQAASTTTAAG